MKKQHVFRILYLIIGLTTFVLLPGCVKDLIKEGVYSETEYKGRVITNEGTPVSGVSVFLRSAAGVRINQQTTDMRKVILFSQRHLMKLMEKRFILTEEAHIFWNCPFWELAGKNMIIKTSYCIIP